MSEPTRFVSIPATTWHRIEIREPSVLRPAGGSTQSPNGALFAFFGRSPPPEGVTAADFPGISSVGFGVLNLHDAGTWWVYYNGTTRLQCMLEPLAGREPPPVESGSGFFFRKGTFNTPIGAGASATVFGANARRKKLNLNLPEGGAVYLRYDGGTPTATNFDVFFEGSLVQSLQFTGEDVPQGSIVALNASAVASVLLIATQWE